MTRVPIEHNSILSKDATTLDTAEVKDRHLCLQLVLEALAGDEGNNMKR